MINMRLTTRTVSIRSLGEDIGLTTAPQGMTAFDQAALVSFIRNAFSQNHHFASSCRMRRAKIDPINGGGVVDPYGNIFDTNNVMVADVSAFPNITGCFHRL